MNVRGDSSSISLAIKSEYMPSVHVFHQNDPFGDLLKTEYFILAPIACVKTHVGGAERVEL